MRERPRSLHRESPDRAALGELVGQTALADSRLTHESHDLAVTLDGPLEG